MLKYYLAVVGSVVTYGSPATLFYFNYCFIWQHV